MQYMQVSVHAEPILLVNRFSNSNQASSYTESTATVKSSPVFYQPTIPPNLDSTASSSSRWCSSLASFHWKCTSSPKILGKKWRPIHGAVFIISVGLIQSFLSKVMDKSDQSAGYGSSQAYSFFASSAWAQTLPACIDHGFPICTSP